MSERLGGSTLSTEIGGGTYRGGGAGVGRDSDRSILRDEFHIGSGISSCARSRRKPRLVVGAPQPSAATCGGVGNGGGVSKTGVSWRVGGSGALATDDVPLGDSVRSRDETLEGLIVALSRAEVVGGGPQKVGRRLSSGSI